VAKAPAKSKTASKVEPVQSIVAYKAFDQNLACRGFQYEVGKTFEMSGEPSICKRGFHACENPFDVFNYYPLGSRVARVTLTGTVDRHGDENQDSKICGVRLTVDAELRMPEIVKAAVAWIVKAAKKNVATGDSGHAAATGYRGHAAATGDSGHAAATGDSGHAAATGDSGHAAATGDRGHAAATGYRGHAAATGDSGHAAATGYRGHAAATGYSGHAAATGDSGHAAATGYSSVAASLGMGGTALAAEGGAICLTYQEYDPTKGKYVLRHIRSSMVGENGIEANKIYRLNAAGDFEQVSSI